METDIYSAFRSLENPSTALDPYLDEVDSGQRPIVVTDATAKTFAPWWQGMLVISGAIAQLPLITYRRLDPKGKERARDHATYGILHRRTNRDLGPFHFKELMTMQALSLGNAYAFIDRKGAKVDGLYPLLPNTVTPFRANGDLKYNYQPPSGSQRVLEPQEVFHLRGPGGDDLQGLSVVGVARESLSGAMQAQRYATRFFKNDARPGIVLEFPDAVDAPTARNILAHWQARHGGSHNASRPAMLDRGGKASPFSMSNTDAQFLESREFSRTEVASWLNLPPHKVGDLSRATFSNIEQQSIDFVVFSLMPWMIRWQDECNAKLFKTSEIRNDTMFVEFLVSALLRGDYNSRMDGHTKGLRMGLFSIDELRDMENLNPLPDGRGESHYITLDMAPVGSEPEADTVVEDEDRSLACLGLISETARAYQRVGIQATRAATSQEKLQRWMIDGPQQEFESLALRLKDAGAETLPFVADLVEEYQARMQAELDKGPLTLKNRIEAVARSMQADRPREIIESITR